MESWKDKLKKVASQVAQGAKDAAETAKVKIDIASLNGKIADEKRSFGSTVYDMFVADNSFEEMKVLFTATQEKIAALKAQIAAKEEELKD